ncbi:Mu transposase C-terminal domain-containing protein [Roseicyclus sp. F158]|uniref:Mu transposase C-terminal domain-containing protein n=1 Tax=Tropicimonas omnivorans TaxID=3075590 RepID=A0ABU3DHA9_9RHOB|nr:Mu transposase C-terminal domain-containing protein [Roseicyclus sp. F158]MDT0683105.1 Mu transposase C-terminal domain-containing protein [Roseicyclus sp. F158]
MLNFAPSGDTPRFAFFKGDKVTIGGIEYRPFDIRDHGYEFVRLDGTGLTETFCRTEIARLADLGHIQHERGALLPAHAKARLALPADLLSQLPDAMHRVARGKEAVVFAFLALEREGKVVRTDASITNAKDTITGRAARMLETPSQYDGMSGSSSGFKVPAFGARTLRRWLRAYEDFGVCGLYNGTGQRGNREARLRLEERMVLADCVRNYMTPGMTQSAVYEDVKKAIRRKNEELRAEGRPDLICPSKETVRKAIKALDPYQCDVARLGAEAARRKYAPVGTGLDLTRPLQWVEIDTWKVDLITLLTDSGLLNFLTEDEKLSFGLTGEKKRWHLTVAICTTTRCIIAMRLSQTPNAQTTLEVIDMIGRDKGVWADAVGTLSPWPMRGTPELILADCGSEYVSYDVRVAARDLGVSFEHAPAGLPEMRARIERVFRTISVNLLARLTGRTFSNVVERGDYDSKGRAALTVDDLCAALTRWVVDIYHRTPHEGLDGETPANCWKRLTEEYGVAPPADLRRRRLAFGTRMKRSVQKDGITIFGVRYHSEFLAETMLHKRDKELNLRWYSEDIGAIAVEIDGEWIEVPSVLARHQGVRAATWRQACDKLRARFKHEAALEEHIVHKAIDDIEQINGEAMKRVGLLSEDWSKEQLEQEEKNLFIGFAIEPDAQGEPQRATSADFGEDFTPSEGDHENVKETALKFEDAFPRRPRRTQIRTVPSVTHPRVTTRMNRTSTSRINR